MHVDHGSLLNLTSNGLIGKVAVCATLVASYRAIYSNRYGETSAFPQPRPSANRLGQAARRRGDREQEVVELNSKSPLPDGTQSKTVLVHPHAGAPDRQESCSISRKK
jgi:hypothetical protein